MNLLVRGISFDPLSLKAIVLNKRFLVLVVALLIGGAAFSLTGSHAPDRAERKPLAERNTDEDALQIKSETRESSIAEVLELATKARASMVGNLKDYTARLVKNEVDSSGVLGEPTEINLKVQTRVRDGTETAPMRVYLDFTKPEAVNGREVIWAKDLHEGKLVVHEAGLLGMMTLHLDPTGMLAMRGQKYPIYDIGLVSLIEKLIERGQNDLDNPEIKVLITDEYPFDGLVASRIEVMRSRPSGKKDDFSRAEVIIDLERQLILRYQSYGWPEQVGQQAPLQESYTYYDIETNVGLSELDFDPTNPAYRFP
ncbi:hypothetical protein Q31b_21230 [Novipirellula aureliae]|uniref:DUF1571 domain-containing protein n=1 Tax=Novipirellula aureliae TaxID=2527966 RepID=A0A5C6E6J8_9BACT|nr:DUF1571 domain-containing protein [Novipirellula aureliae]TWU43086.1 hypothetical protein Q31b_21230 [Novipirellula aureliae]